MSVLEIGCCGAYCGTCQVMAQKACRGCKIGYSDGERELSAAKCKMKVCCMGRGFDSCADCGEYETCAVLNDFYSKNGYKYGKYKQATVFIRKNGYVRFLDIADKWKGAYGGY